MSMQVQHSQFQFIPAHALKLSPLNVRKTATEVGIDELAQLIRAEGLLQNLNVHPLDISATPSYGVVAGGRRLRALKQLIRAKHFPADHPVPCMIVSEERAIEISLAENSGREAMHPADEFDAFRQLIDAGQTMEDVAARFGVTPLVVKRRLRLANVSPALVEEYRNGKITLEHLMAFAICDDHERQEQVWASLKTWERRPETIRERLVDGDMPLTHPIARYVGLKAYQKAGGVVKRDLFAEDEECFLDAALVRQLAGVKLEKHAAKLKAEGLAWVETHLEFGYGARATFGRVSKREREATEAEQSQLKSLEQRLEEFEQAEFDEQSGLEAADQKAWSQTERALDALRETLTAADPEQLAVAGAVVTIGRDGRIEVERDLLKPEDAARFKSLQRIAARHKVDGTPWPHSAALTRRLTAERTLALQATLSSHPSAALAALTECLVLQTFYPESGTRTGLQIHTGQNALGHHAHELEGSLAQSTMAAWRTRVKETLPDSPDGLLSSLSSRSPEELIDVLAYCSAATIDGIQAQEGGSPLDELAKLSELDMTKWWRATATNYFGRLPKARVLEVIAEAKTAEVASSLANLKKGPLTQAAEKAMENCRWLPSVLKTPI